MRDVLKVELQRLVDEMNADPALAAGWTDPQLRVFTNADELAGVLVNLVKAVAPRSLADEWLWDWGDCSRTCTTSRRAWSRRRRRPRRREPASGWSIGGKCSCRRRSR